MSGGGVWLDELRRGVLAPHQQSHLADVLASRWSWRLGCRQSAGKSFVLTAVAVCLAVWGVDGPPHDVLMISAREETAKNLIRQTRAHLRALSIAEESPVDARFPALDRIALKNGRYIQAHPGPEALQGFTGSVIVDEFSLLAAAHDAEAVLGQALSVSSRQPYFKVAACTNADHAGSWVDQFLNVQSNTARRQDWAISNVTIWDIYPDGLPPHIEAIRRQLTAREWAKWFENQFVPADGGIFTEEAITQSSARFTDLEAPVRILSIDPGFTIDATGWAIADVANGAVDYLDGGHEYGDEKAIVAMALKAVDQGGVRRIYIDPGSAGLLLAKWLEEAGLPVTRVSVNDSRRDDWIERLERMIANSRIRLRARAIIDDLSFIGRDGASFVFPKRPAPIKGRKIHCDAASAALAILHAPETIGGGVDWVNFGAVRRASIEHRILQ